MFAVVVMVVVAVVFAVVVIVFASSLALHGRFRGRLVFVELSWTLVVKFVVFAAAVVLMLCCHHVVILLWWCGGGRPGCRCMVVVGSGKSGLGNVQMFNASCAHVDCWV